MNTSRKTALALGVLMLSALAAPYPRLMSAAADPASEQALDEFLRAGDQAGAVKRIDAVLKSGVPFDEVLARLRRGRDYSSKVGRGRQQNRNGTDHTYLFVVPDKYDPARAYQLPG